MSYENMKIWEYNHIYQGEKKSFIFSVAVYHQVGRGDPNQKSSCKHRDPPWQICLFLTDFKDLLLGLNSRIYFKDLFQEYILMIYFKDLFLERCRRTWASHCQWPAVEIDKSRWDFRRCKPDRRRSLPLVKYHKVGICKIVDINLGQNSMGICKWLRSSLVQKNIDTWRHLQNLVIKT